MERRNVLAGVGSGTSIVLAGCTGMLDSEPDDEETEQSDSNDGESSDEQQTGETFEVGPGESIQAAVNEAAAGDTVSVSEATYEQTVSVEKNLTIRAPDGATLDGSAIESGPAFTVEANDVDLDGFEIIRYSGGGVISESAADELSIRNIDLSNNGNTPIDITAHSVHVANLLTEGNKGTGVRIQLDRTGEASIEDVDIRQAENDGLLIAGGESVTVDGFSALQNGGKGLVIEGGDARGQDVSITDVRTIENGETGLSVAGTDGDDDISLRTVETLDNVGKGAKIRGERVQVRDVEATGNGLTESGIAITSSGSGEVTVEDATINRTQGSGSTTYPGRGLEIIDGDQITLSNITAEQNTGDQLQLKTDVTRGRTIEIDGATLTASEDGSGLYIEGTNGNDTVSIRNAESSNHSERGFDISGDIVDLSNVEARENGLTDAGIRIASSADGEVTVTDSTIEQTYGNSGGGWIYNGGRGLSISDGKRVTIENVSLSQNHGNQIKLETSTARDQVVEIADCELDQNEVESGLYIEGSVGEDTVSIDGVDSTNHYRYGFEIGGETVTITDSIASGNGSGPVLLRDIPREEATIENSFE